MLPKGCKMVAKKLGVFNWWNEVVFFFVTGQIGMKFGPKNFSWCPLLNLNRRILKIFH